MDALINASELAGPKKQSFFALLRNYLIVQGLLLSYGLAIWTYRLFLKAYFSEEKRVVIYIDVFGEAYTELILLTASIFLMSFAVVHVLRMVRQNQKEKS